MSTSQSANTASVTPSNFDHSASRLELAVILAAQLLFTVDITVVTVAMPSIESAMSMSTISLSWVQNAYTLAFGGLLLLGGRAGDLLGRRRMVTLGVAVFTGAALLGGLSPSLGLLLVARAAQGIGAAMASPNVLALIAANRTGRDRARALGLFSAVTGSGFAVGMIVGGVLTAWMSWRGVLLFNVPIGVLIVLGCVLRTGDTERHAGRFDSVSAVTSTVGVTALVYALTQAASDGWSSTTALGGLGVAAVCLTSFVLVEKRAAQPILPLRLFASRVRLGGYLGMFLVMPAALGVFFFLTQYVQQIRQFGPLDAGLAFLPMAVTLFAVSRIAPRLLPRCGARTLVALGMTSVIGADVWLSLLSNTSPYLAGMLGPLVLLGLGIGLVFMPLNAVILTDVPAGDSGVAAGALQVFQQVGLAFGLGVLAVVFGYMPGRDLLAGVDEVFGAASVFAAGALVVVLCTVRRR